MNKTAIEKDIIRQCVSCKKDLKKNTLIRILRDYKTGEYVINPNKKQFGRSFYICKSVKCIEDLQKNKRYRDKVETEKLKEKIE